MTTQAVTERSEVVTVLFYFVGVSVERLISVKTTLIPRKDGYNEL